MTEHQRDELLRDMRDRLERIEREHGAALRDHGAKLDTLRGEVKTQGGELEALRVEMRKRNEELPGMVVAGVLAGIANSGYATRAEVTNLERRVADLERQAG